MQASSQVQYDGDPQFEPIENTEMGYALNSSTAIIRVRGRYYNCDKGVWFEGPTPNGPWGVCIAVPPDIYTIPPRCPVYYVRYVRVYSYTPEVAYVGYTSGYTGCYVHGGTVVYGTGYYYRPWFRRSYFPRPWTWGFGVHYDPGPDGPWATRPAGGGRGGGLRSTTGGWRTRVGGVLSATGRSIGRSPVPFTVKGITLSTARSFPSGLCADPRMEGHAQPVQSGTRRSMTAGQGE